MISGRTEIIAHLGHPTESFTAPMIYNPWFEAHGIDAVRRAKGARLEIARFRSFADVRRMHQARRLVEDVL